MTRACEVCGADRFAPLVEDAGYAWQRCEACGFVRLTEPLSAAEASAIEAGGTDMYVAEYQRKFASKMRRTKRRARRMWRRRPGNRFLDLGSNYGFMVEAAAAIGFDAVGVEINPGLVEAARQRFPGRDFRAGVLEAQDFAGQLFDCVYCSEVIEHTVDPGGFARTIAQAMRPGGILYLTTPHQREYAKRGWKDMGAPGHKLYFDNPTVTRLLKNAGFARVKHDFTYWRGIKLWAVRG